MTDEPCTQEDRDRIVAAALLRKAQLNDLICELGIASTNKYYSAYVRSLFLDATTQLRQLIDSRRWRGLAK